MTVPLTLPDKHGSALSVGDAVVVPWGGNFTVVRFTEAPSAHGGYKLLVEAPEGGRDIIHPCHVAKAAAS